jgi:hypothetical protein
MRERWLILGVKTETGPQMRLVVATHAATSSPPPSVLSKMVLFVNSHPRLMYIDN